jgi:nicotinamidase/pyrazinamidase
MTHSRDGDGAALLVIDVQRDFCPGGALPAPGSDRILPAINAYLAAARDLGLPVYASRDWHPAVTTHFKPYGGEWPPHCVKGSPGARFHPDLRLPANAIVVSKGEDPGRAGYSAFDGRTAEGQTLSSSLRDRHVARLYVCGIATEYCVRQSTIDALRFGLQVTVLTDAIAGIDAHPGDADRALSEMIRAGAAFATSLGLAHAATRCR